MTEIPAISINRLGKTYRGKKGITVCALAGLDLELAPGEVFGFLGPNGAGKSTTIKILTGQIRASEGQALLFGCPASDPRSRLQVGYLPENPSFYDFLTAGEYLRFVGKAYRMSGAGLAVAISRVLERLDLAAAANRPIRGFSKGMVQRLGLAQALLPDPDLLLLDEPMSGLDPLGRSLVKEIIKEQKQAGKTIFFSTHITADVEIVCDRVGILAEGRLRALDRVENVLAHGIQGYKMQLVENNGTVKEKFVAAESLRPTLEQILSDGGAIERVEPVRRDLEQFFLDVVKDAGHESA